MTKEGSLVRGHQYRFPIVCPSPADNCPICKPTPVGFDVGFDGVKWRRKAKDLKWAGFIGKGFSLIRLEERIFQVHSNPGSVNVVGEDSPDFGIRRPLLVILRLVALG